MTGELFPVAAAIGVAGAGIGMIAKPVADLVVRTFWEKQALRGELADIERHFAANLRVIDAALMAEPISGARLSSVHATRFAILPDSLILQPESFRHLPFKWMGNVYRFKLFMRNVQLDIDQLATLMNTGSHDEVLAALRLMRTRFAAAIEIARALRLDPTRKPATPTEAPSLIWIQHS